MNKPYFLLIMLLCQIPIISGCPSGFVPDRLTCRHTIPVTITFPAAGSHYLTWLDDRDEFQTISLTTDSASAVAAIELQLPAGTATPVSVYYSDQEHPLGCVYPSDTDCTPAGGWTAHILSQFLKKTPGTNVRHYAGTFNWQRLTTLAQKQEDPWLIDEETILRAIHDGTFDASLVSRTKNR